MSETPVLEFDTASCVPPDDNRPAERPGINTLVEGIRANTPACAGAGMPAPGNPRQVP